MVCVSTESGVRPRGPSPDFFVMFSNGFVSVYFSPGFWAQGVRDPGLLCLVYDRFFGYWTRYDCSV